ncbi:hypothetical protein HPB50_027532 [Hyalomma asiaticum]|uniref:Uncharacterized protein n=1 Tax=Hyalomma asiaticum TaxID=266040 RepID=A0ACB7SRN1_HYAAI|nr:hypothetical protein HPB50_027532 [Hyalomma asiaticum]
MAPRGPPVLCVIVAVSLVSTTLVCADEAQQQAAHVDPTGTDATKRDDSGEAAKTGPPVQPKDSAVPDADKKAERMEPSEASKEAEGGPRHETRGNDDAGKSSSDDDQHRRKQQQNAALIEDAEDLELGEDAPSDSPPTEEEPLEDSVESALGDFQHLRDVLDGSASRREDNQGGLSAFVSNVLRTLYSVITYDFCQASAIASEQTAIPPQGVPAQTSPPTAGKGEDSGASETMEPPCEHKGSRLADWRAWREAGHKHPKAVINRLACLLRSAGYHLYPVRRPAQFWPQGDVCTALCQSCECDYDENSTCGLARLAWKARTPAVVYNLYCLLHNSRALCATALLLGVLRKQLVYRVVLCTPLVILIAMVHPEKHAEIAIGRLNQAMSSLAGLSAFVETTRGYYQTKVGVRASLNPDKSN